MDPLAPITNVPPSGVPMNTAPEGVGTVAAGLPEQMPAPSPAPGLEHPLRPLIAQWTEKLTIAKEFKKAKFGDDAEEAMRFFSGPYEFLYAKNYRGSGGYDDSADEEAPPPPSYKMTVNKVAEAVQIFGPVLYHRNPVRQVNPREVPQIPPEFLGNLQDPAIQMQIQQAMMEDQAARAMDKMRSTLLQFYLNWTPTECRLKDHGRRGIDEAIIKGAGLLWTEVYTMPGTNAKAVGSFYDSIDHLLIDPDAETLEDALWIARRCIHPGWKVEQEYGLEPGTLRSLGVAESADNSSALNTSEDGAHQRAAGRSNDLVSYWKIYSKMGIGGRLSGMTDQQRVVLDQFGDYCYLVVVEGLPYPLNVPPAVIDSADPAAAEDILKRLEWPTAFWADDEWPMSPLYFHEVPRCPWPMSHFKPAMGELKFLNWAYSFLAGKMRTTCRDFIAIAKSAGPEIKDAILNGKDLTLLEIEAAHGTISEIVQFLQHPAMNGDIWKVIEAVTANFEKRTGLTELVYGQSAQQFRSAAEADLKGSQLQIRPDDMAQRVEDWMTLVARKEAICARQHLTGEDVAPVMGPMAAAMWEQTVLTTDLFAMTRQLDYRIEAGSAKKPNKARDAANMETAMQQLFPPLFQYMMTTGNVGPVNQLLMDWGKSIDLKTEGYMLMPPPPPAAGEQGGPPEEKKEDEKKPPARKAA